MAEALAYELKWTLFNDMWAVVNSGKAWTFPKRSSHSELVMKAAHDSRRAGQHAKKAEDMNLMSADAIKSLRGFAVAAANEVSVLAIHGGEFEQKFEHGSMLNLEASGVRNDIVFQFGAWEAVIEAIKFGAAHIYYLQKGGKKDQARTAKVEMERSFATFGEIAKTNIRVRDEAAKKAEMSAKEDAEREAKEAKKAKEKAEKKARELRKKWRRDPSQKTSTDLLKLAIAN